MYPLKTQNLIEKLVSSFGSEYIDWNNENSKQEIIHQIVKEINAHQENTISGFWWDNDSQREKQWITKIKLSWRTELGDFQEIHQFIKELFHTEEIDLSFDKGLIGLILMLNRENLKYKDLVIEDFIDKTTQFLLSKKMKLNTDWQQFSFFSEAFDEDTWTSNNILSWKVGDLHFVKLLYRLSKINQNRNYHELAENIGLYTTTRITEQQTQIKDSSLANGSSGLALLYKALYDETFQKHYLKASNYWIERTDIFLETELQNGYYDNRKENILDGLLGVVIVLQKLQEEKMNPLLIYLAG